MEAACWLLFNVCCVACVVCCVLFDMYCVRCCHMVSIVIVLYCCISFHPPHGHTYAHAKPCLSYQHKSIILVSNTYCGPSGCRVPERIYKSSPPRKKGFNQPRFRRTTHVATWLSIKRPHGGGSANRFSDPSTAKSGVVEKKVFRQKRGVLGEFAFPNSTIHPRAPNDRQIGFPADPRTSVGLGSTPPSVDSVRGPAAAGNH